MAADEVLVLLLALNRTAGSTGSLERGGLLNRCHDGSPVVGIDKVASAHTAAAHTGVGPGRCQPMTVRDSAEGTRRFEHRSRRRAPHQWLLRERVRVSTYWRLTGNPAADCISSVASGADAGSRHTGDGSLNAL